MKRVFSLVATFALLLSLCACSGKSDKVVKTSKETAPSTQSPTTQPLPTETTGNPTEPPETTESTEPPETTESTEPPETTESTEPPETTEGTEPPVATTPPEEALYTVELFTYTPIYQYPSSDSAFVRNVEAYGIYTIMEEAVDEKGNLWGRLKSGVGWVILRESSCVCSRCGGYFPYKGLYDDGLCEECYFS